MRFRFSGVALSVALTHVFSLAQVTTIASPQAEVTFYSSGSFLKSAIPGDKHAKFSGRIMVGRTNSPCFRSVNLSRSISIQANTS